MSWLHETRTITLTFVIEANDPLLSQAIPSDLRQKTTTIFGMPLSTAIVYALFFIVAFWFYTAVWPSAPISMDDSSGYFRAARDLADLHMTRLQERAPGYPLLLVLTRADRSPRILFVVSLLLHFASIWLLGVVLWRAGLTEMKLNLFNLILLLPPFVEPAGYVLTENLTEAMLVAAFVSLILWRLDKKTIWVVISAATIAYAALTRPTYQVLALALAGYLLLEQFLLRRASASWKTAVKGSAVVICGSVMILGSYAYFNYRNFGYFVVTPKFGLTLSLKTVRALERLPDEYSGIRQVLINARNATAIETGATGHLYIWGLVPDLEKITGLDGPQLSDYMLKLNLLLIQKAPLLYLQEVFWAFAAYWLPSSDELANFNSTVLQMVWGVIHFLLVGGVALNMILLAGAAVYMYKCNLFGRAGSRSLRDEDQAALIHLQAFMFGLAAMIVIYTAVVSCMFEIGSPRYRTPTDSLIVLMLFVGTHLWGLLVKASTTAFCGNQGHTV